jgi:hypothetical protein
MLGDVGDAGKFILPVREGFLCLPYDTVDADDREILDLDRAFLLDKACAVEMLSGWLDYSDGLTGALRDLVRILMNPRQKPQ